VVGGGGFWWGGDVPKNKHTALLGYRLLNMLQNLNTTLFVLCGHHIVLTMVSVQDWLNVCLFLMVLCGHFLMLTASEQEGHVVFHNGSADLKFIRRNIFSYETAFV
jgi:hypothetical protein